MTETIVARVHDRRGTDPAVSGVDVERDDVREAFQRDGFALLDGPVLPLAAVAAAERGLERLKAGRYRTGRPPEPSPWSPGDPPDRLVKVELPQRADFDLAALVASPAIGEAAAAATGAEWVQVWWVQLLEKPPAAQGPAATRVGWHQDWHYWHSTWEAGSELLTAWVALADVPADSGPLTFVPGSHRWGLVEGGDFFGQDDVRDRLALPPGAAWREVPALLPAGGLSLHGAFTLHGSAPSRADRPRRSLAIHLRTERSRTIGGGRPDLARHVDDLEVCPVIHGERRAR